MSKGYGELDLAEARKDTIRYLVSGSLYQETPAINLKCRVRAGSGHKIWSPKKVGRCGLDKTLGITNAL